MIRKFWAVLRWTVGGFAALVASVVLATAPAVAQSTQSSVTASVLFNGSTQQSFQNATSQIQNGSTSNDTSTGSGSVLRQAPANSDLIVSSGPENQQAPQAAQHATNWTAFWLWIVVIASLVGLFALYLYNRQQNKRQAVAAAEVAEEIIEQVKTKQEPSKSAKKSKSKKKTKKHHR